jgi:hypothetical protein
MKCSFCTYNHQPTNPILLKAHAELEQLEGKTDGKVPVIVFRDGDFIIVKEAEEGEQTFFFNIQDILPKEEEVIAEDTTEE